MKKIEKAEMKQITGGIAPPCYWECVRKRDVCVQSGNPTAQCYADWYTCDDIECGDEEFKF